MSENFKGFPGKSKRLKRRNENKFSIIGVFKLVQFAHCKYLTKISAVCVLMTWTSLRLGDTVIGWEERIQSKFRENDCYLSNVKLGYESHRRTNTTEN